MSNSPEKKNKWHMNMEKYHMSSNQRDINETTERCYFSPINTTRVSFFVYNHYSPMSSKNTSKEWIALSFRDAFKNYFFKCFLNLASKCTSC